MQLSEIYSLLGVDVENGQTISNLEGARQLYKAAAKESHPDQNGGTKEATQRFQQINQAYQEIQKVLKGQQHAAEASTNNPAQTSRQAQSDTNWQKADDAFYEAYQNRQAQAQQTRSTEPKATPETEARETSVDKEVEREKFQAALRFEETRRKEAQESLRSADYKDYQRQARILARDPEQRRDTILSYTLARQDLIKGELGSNIHKRDQFRHAIAEFPELRGSALFQRADTLEALRDMPTSDIGKLQQTDSNALNSGIFTDPASAKSMAISNLFLRYALQQEAMDTSRAASNLTRLAPEDSEALTAKALSTAINEAKEAGVSVNSQWMQEKPLSQSRSAREDVRTAVERLGKDRLGSVAKFDAVDPVYQKFSAVHAAAQETAQRFDAINAPQWMPSSQAYADLKVSRELINSAARNRTDVLERDAIKKGALYYVATRLNGFDEPTDHARRLQKEPTSLESQILNETISGNGGFQPAIHRAASELHERVAAYNTGISQTAEQSAQELRQHLFENRDPEHLSENDVHREYDASRAASKQLHDVATDLQNGRHDAPIDREKLKEVMALFPEDARKQLSSKELGKISKGLAPLIPDTLEASHMRLTVEAVTAAVPVFKEAEIARWSTISLQADRDRKDIEVSIEQSRDDIAADADRSKLGQNLFVALSKEIDAGTLGNPAPKHRDDYTQAATYFAGITRSDAYNEESVSLAKGMVKGGLASISAHKLSAAAGSVEHSLQADEVKIQNMAESLEAEHRRSGLTKDAFLKERNHDLAEALIEQGHYPQKGAQRALRDSFDREGLTSRYAEARSFKDHAGPAAGDLYLAVRAQERASQSALQNEMLHAQAGKRQATNRDIQA